MMIEEAYRYSKGTYGSRRISIQLRKWGVICNRNQVARLMQEHSIKPKSKRKYRRTTHSNHKLPIASNLIERRFTSEKDNQVWMGDITYIWTRQGWLYLSTVIDLYSRRVVGWSLDSSLSKRLVLDSFNNAVQLRKPEEGLIFHSDRGSQYASKEFKDALRRAGAIQSMSRKGDCWDNAVAESFFKTIKSEMINFYIFKTRQEAELKIFEYIEVFYNRKRLHSALNYMTPYEFEMKNLS